MKKLRNKEIKKLSDGRILRNFSISQFLNFSLKGFGLVESLVGVSIIAVFLVGVVGAGSISSRLIEGAESRLQAAFLLEGGIDAVKGIRDAGWASNVVPLALDTDYWLVFSGGAWTLNASAQPFIDGKFDRRVRLSAVLRDAGDDIVDSGGTDDPGSKKVIVTVSWSDRGATTTAALSTYITNLFSN